MSKTVEFYYDFSSPYTYIASERIEKVCREHGASLDWKPFLLGGVFNEIGSTPAAQIDNKINYLKRDMIMCADYYGVPLNFPEVFPLNSVRSMRGAFAASEQGKLVEYNHLMFRLYFTQGADLSRPEVLGEAVSTIGIDSERFLARIAEQEIKDMLRDETNIAIERRVFGAPTMFVDDKMYWGNDRLDFLDRYLKESASRS
jgi:2-hydroxychromene-2-carboxylate isomerase